MSIFNPYSTLENDSEVFMILFRQIEKENTIVMTVKVISRKLFFHFETGVEYYLMTKKNAEM